MSNRPRARFPLVSRDAVSAGFFLLVGVFYYVSSLQYDVYIKVGGIEKPGPGLLPRGLAIAIILVGLVSLITSLLRGRKKPAEGFRAVCENLGLQRRNASSCLLMVLGIVAYLLVVDFAGFLLTSIAVIMFMLWALGERRWWFNVLLGVGSGLSTYWLFWTLMRVPLPIGTLWE